MAFAAKHDPDHRGEHDDRYGAADAHQRHHGQGIGIGAGVEGQAVEPDLVPEVAERALTGFDQRETDVLGNVRSEVEYLTFQLGADVSAMDLRERDLG